MKTTDMTPDNLQPPEGCVILGWGGTFEVPSGGFYGYMLVDGKFEFFLHVQGMHSQTLYAAPIDSEIARLNAESTWNAQADEWNQWCDLGDDERESWINGTHPLLNAPPDSGQKGRETGTPRVDAYILENGGWGANPLELARALGRELAAKDAILREILSELPVGYLPNHTIENMPDMVSHWVKEAASASVELEKAEETIAAKDALIGELSLCKERLKGEEFRHDITQEALGEVEKKLAEKDDVISALEAENKRLREQSNGRLEKLEEHADTIELLRSYCCKSCGGSGITPGWTPSYNDPCNEGGHPEAEPCDCEAGKQRFPEMFKNSLISRLPHTADGKPIIIGDTVWFENPDYSHGDDVLRKGVVDSIYSPITFTEYKGTFGIQADDSGHFWDGGNLDCWSSKEAAEKAFARELENDQAAQLEDDRKEEVADRLESIRRAEQEKEGM